jgi:uncharacterized protein YoxC
MICLAASLIVNFKLIDVIHKLDANIDEDADTYGWTTESLESEVKELRRQNENLQRQNDFLIGRM